MNDELVLIIPECSESRISKRLESVLAHCLTGYHTTTISCAEELSPLCDRRILFVVQVDETGINLEYCRMLKKIRKDRTMFEGCIGGLIVDGVTEGFTKAISRELVLTANIAGCAFIGRPLVEATGSLSNFKIQAANLNTDLCSAYLRAAKVLTDRLMGDQPSIQNPRPRLLVLHASNRKTSNTLSLWNMVKQHLEHDCMIEEVTLLNGAVVDCIGCPYTTCSHLGEQGHCFYGGTIVDEVYPAVITCDALVLLCPNYNDSLSANICAFINRMTALYRKTRFYDKKIFGIIVSGYSGGDILARQLISSLNMNKSFALPPRFALMATAHAPGSIHEVSEIEEQAAAFAANIKKSLLSICND